MASGQPDNLAPEGVPEDGNNSSDSRREAHQPGHHQRSAVPNSIDLGPIDQDVIHPTTGIIDENLFDSLLKDSSDIPDNVINTDEACYDFLETVPAFDINAIDAQLQNTSTGLDLTFNEVGPQYDPHGTFSGLGDVDLFPQHWFGEVPGPNLDDLCVPGLQPFDILNHAEAQGMTQPTGGDPLLDSACQSQAGVYIAADDSNLGKPDHVQTNTLKSLSSRSKPPMRLKPILPKPTDPKGKGPATQTGNSNTALSITRTSIGKRKRAPTVAQPAEDCFSVFAASGLVAEGQPAAGLRKRDQYAKNTCLRCQVSKAKCSGGFPCERCMALRCGPSRKRAALHWMACFDSNIEELNYFIDFYNMKFVFGTMDGGPSHSVPEQYHVDLAEDLEHLKVFQASSGLFDYVTGISADAGFAKHIHGQKSLIGLLPGSNSSDGRNICNDHEDLIVPRQIIPSINSDSTPFTWFLAALHLQPRFLSHGINWSGELYAVIKSAAFRVAFELVGRLLQKAKAERCTPLELRSLCDILRTLSFFVHTDDMQRRIVEALFEAAAAKAYKDPLKAKAFLARAADDHKFNRLGKQGRNRYGVRMKDYWEPYRAKEEHLKSFLQYWLDRFGGSRSLEDDGFLFLVHTLRRLNIEEEPMPYQHPVETAKIYWSEICDLGNAPEKARKSHSRCFSKLYEIDMGGKGTWLDLFDLFRKHLFERNCAS